MNRWRKASLLVLAAGLIVVAGLLQGLINRQRAALGLTRTEPLENAPPVLALTTQALGGFRGLIANALWVRATDLQQEGQYFEMVQLADWITKLQPRLSQVWIMQAWNLAYNISVKFSAFPDRWRWLQRGIELLRDEGLKYNPDDPLLYRELAWFFQHKMGATLDDAHNYYKMQWAMQMTNAFGGPRPDLPTLLAPKTTEASNRVQRLREVYKLDPKLMQEIDERYGPLDWRLPEAHAIYWGVLGLQKSKSDDKLMLRRAVYQPMLMAFQRGRLYPGADGQWRFGPNLEIIPQVNRTYEEAIKSEPDKKDTIQRAHAGFLREAIYQLYLHNRLSDANRWLEVLRKEYPVAMPAGIGLPEYVMGRLTEDVGEGSGSQARVASVVQGFVLQSYLAVINDDDSRAAELMARAREIRDVYQFRIKDSPRLAIPPLDDIKRIVLDDMLNPEMGMVAEARARLLTKLGLPADYKPALPTPPPAPPPGTTPAPK